MNKLKISIAATVIILAIASTVNSEVTAANKVVNIDCWTPSGIISVPDDCIQTDVSCGCFSLTNHEQELFRNP